MSVELQFQATTLAAMVENTAAQQLATTCLPLFPGFSIDHIDVVAGSATVAQSAAGPSVQLALNLFIVTDSELFAHANQTPPGALVPRGRIGVTYLITAPLEPVTVAGVTTNRSFMSLAPGPIQLPDLPPVPGLNPADIERQLRAALPTVKPELTQVLTLLGLPSPQRTSVEPVGDTLALRFDPGGSSQRRLFAGQAWGFFVDAKGLENLVLGRLKKPIQDAVPAATVTARYVLEGGAPKVIVEVGLTIVGDFIGHPEIRLAVDLGAVLSLLPGPKPLVRVSMDWSFHIFADAVPGFLEALAEKLAETVASELIDPALFGATRTGDRSFFIDIALPDVAMPGAQLRIDSLQATADGMTLGGAVKMRPYAPPVLAVRQYPLGMPYRFQRCRENARSGSGAPSKEPPSIFNTRCQGQVVVEGGGRLCAVDQRTPVASLAPYFTPAPPIGSTDDTVRVTVLMPYAVAMNLPQPLTLVLRTARGVRFIDLGVAPKLRVGAGGVLLDNVRDFYLKDCLVVVAREKGAWGIGWSVSPDDMKTRPIEEPDWATYLQQAPAGLQVQMVRLQGLDAHELLRFRSASHAIDVTADAQGRAAIPAMLPLSQTVGPALLARANGRTLEGHFDVETVVFERHLTLPGRLAAPPVANGSGGLRVFTETRTGTQGRKQVADVSGLGARLRPAGAGQETELNPQPLPPVDSPLSSTRLAARAGLAGVERVVLMPGFDDMAVALMADGSQLLLEVPVRSGQGPVRIAGTFAGPVGKIVLAGPWAVSQTGPTLAVFQVKQERRHDGCGSSPAALPRRGQELA